MLLDAKFNEAIKKPAEAESSSLSGLGQQAGCSHSRYGIGLKDINFAVFQNHVGTAVTFAKKGPMRDFGVSLGLSGGKLRFTVNNRYLESAVLEKGKWIHVAGTWDGSEISVCINGQRAKSSGSLAVTPVGCSFTLKPGKPSVAF